ncbi:nicotianamine synthase [Desulfonema ishimotonii]|uniref:Nicotianamine synthase n=1 Tax=Desulfonema ishimotonii TaxID=45657 RepID=A0A401FYG3_9BACT|nr:nicotianamine synthase family protein [Desulfonema ishimotonii]GBC62009.1 nicotianamine synthase [Desulfonema ishimotonii]
MHDINYFHEHELGEHDFLGCCKDCQRSLAIVKPHILSFANQIRQYTPEMLRALEPDALFRLYQLLDDLAHMEVGGHLAGLILEEPEIRRNLPDIRAYYSAFFSIHERHLASALLKAEDPWKCLRDFPLYPRYEALVRNQITAMHISSDCRLAFIGSGPVPMTLILMSRLFGIRSVGLDSDPETVSLSRRVIRYLGLAGQIDIVQGDDSHLRHLEWDMVLVAALAEPKATIFRHIRECLKERESPPVVFRTYTDMKAVLFRPVQPEDIREFKIVRVIRPVGRVNNTTVFLKQK